MVGVLALACLAAWGAMFYLPETTNASELWQGSFLRVGIMLAAFWIALPARGRDAAWSGIHASTLGGAVLIVFLTARLKFAVIPIAAAIITIGLFLRPRNKPRPGSRGP